MGGMGPHGASPGKTGSLSPQQVEPTGRVWCPYTAVLQQGSGEGLAGLGERQELGSPWDAGAVLWMSEEGVGLDLKVDRMSLGGRCFQRL